jgi:hypothetical protein
VTILFISEPLDVVLAPEIPEQFQNNGAKKNFFGGEERISFGEIHLVEF